MNSWCQLLKWWYFVLVRYFLFLWANGCCYDIYSLSQNFTAHSFDVSYKSPKRDKNILDSHVAIYKAKFDQNETSSNCASLF